MKLGKINIFTDGSKLEGKTGSAFFIFDGENKEIYH